MHLQQLGTFIKLNPNTRRAEHKKQALSISGDVANIKAEAHHAFLLYYSILKR